MNISILGCGRWGTFLAWYFERKGFNVALWGRETSTKMQRLKNDYKNEYLAIPTDVKLTTSLKFALGFSSYVIIAIEGQNTRLLMQEIVKEEYSANSFVLCMKGLEDKTFKRLTEIVSEYIRDRSKIAIWVGPAQPQNLLNNIPTCMIIDSWDESLKNRLSNLFNSDLIKTHPGNDVIGNEIASATKNIIGIAGGMLNGLGYASLKGLLMVAGTKEIAELIQCFGGNYNTAYGLSCLGDYEASLFSEHSNSVNFGVSFSKRTPFRKYTPGIYTAKTIEKYIEKNNMNLPLLKMVGEILSEKTDVHDLVNSVLNYTY